MKKCFFVCVMAAVISASLSGQYSLTVNQDRLINAVNEPQNWLLMNGDYGSTRYSKLTQINRENVKNLRMVWALALGGMQDVGQNGPENEVNPLIDNGFMYTTDGWGTVYKIDARNPQPGRVRVDRRSGRAARGQRAAHARHRALGRPRAGQPARRPRHRHQSRQRRDRVGQEDRHQERVRRSGEVPHRAARGRRQGHHPERGRRRRHARLGRGARRQDRQRALALVCRAEARRSRQRDLEGRPQRLEDGRRRDLADRVLRPRNEALHRRHRQPVSDLRSRSSGLATTCTPTPPSPSTSTPASSRGISSTRRTIRGTTTRSACTCCTTRRSTAARAKSSVTSRATASSTRSIGRTARFSRRRST